MYNQSGNQYRVHAFVPLSISSRDVNSQPLLSSLLHYHTHCVEPGVNVTCVERSVWFCDIDVKTHCNTNSSNGAARDKHPCACVSGCFRFHQNENGWLQLYTEMFRSSSRKLITNTSNNSTQLTKDQYESDNIFSDRNNFDWIFLPINALIYLCFLIFANISVYHWTLNVNSIDIKGWTLSNHYDTELYFNSKHRNLILKLEKGLYQSRGFINIVYCRTATVLVV